MRIYDWQWHKWFAWYPVKGFWLVFVWRRQNTWTGGWEYARYPGL